MKVQFKKAKAIGLNKLPIETIKVHMLLAEAIHTQTQSISWGRIAQNMYDGLEVELSEGQLKYLQELMLNDAVMISIAVKEAVLKLIEEVLSSQDVEAKDELQIKK